MEQSQFSTIIETSFQLQASFKDSRLYLHAQNLQDNTQFHLELDSNSIARLTNNLFSDAQLLGQTLQKAANNTSPDFKVSLNHDGRLDYSAQTSENRFSFSLELDRQGVPFDSAVSLGKKVKPFEDELEKVKLQYQEELVNIKLKYEERITGLEQMVLQEQEKNAKMQAEYEAKLSKTKDIRPSRPRDHFPGGQICFRTDWPTADYFEFSDDYKTAKLVGWGDTRVLKCYPNVPETGKHTFSLKVNQIGSWIGFGITTREGGVIYQGDEGNYFYFIGDGMFLNKDFQTNDKIQGAGEKDSIVEMTVDMDARALVFCVDGKQVRSYKLDMKEKEYIVFVDFASMEDSVTLF